MKKKTRGDQQSRISNTVTVNSGNNSSDQTIGLGPRFVAGRYLCHIATVSKSVIYCILHNLVIYYFHFSVATDGREYSLTFLILFP